MIRTEGWRIRVAALTTQTMSEYTFAPSESA